MFRSADDETRFAARETSCDDAVVLGLIYAGVARRKSEVGYLVRVVTGSEEGKDGPTEVVRICY